MPEQDPTAATVHPAAPGVSPGNSRNVAEKRRDPNEPAAVVGLGASAGGVAVLQQFFSDMPAESGLAFVVVMHLSPDFESQLANVLQQKTTMPVVQVSGPVKVKPNHVYVIPPNHQLTFEESTLKLIEPQHAPGRRVTIDLFFRTLAQAYGQRAVGAILSGTDSDGVIGLKHVRAQGGVTIAQDPEEAEFDSMPRSAINTGMVDWVLPIARLAPKLMEFVNNERAMQLPPEIPEAEEPDVKVMDAPGGETISEETRDPEDEAALAEVLKHVRANTGHDFSHYKRASILRRVARRMQVNSVDSIPRYLEFVHQYPAETRALLRDLLIGVTHFFRDREAFASLEAQIPQLFAGKNRTDEIRAWVAGCATGEEAYSIAILLCEHTDKLPAPPSIQVFATDIDEQAIHEARQGFYPATIEADVSPERLRRFFTRDSGGYRIKTDLRDRVLFAVHNVLSEPAFSRLDLATCRNLMIYLKREAQEQIFELFHFALRPGGLLFMGGAESADSVRALFSPIDGKHRVYVRRSIPRPTWKMPPLPTRILAPTRPGGRAPTLARMTSADVEDAGAQSDASDYGGQERRAALFGELHLKLLEQYGPPSLVVNEEHDIVHLSEHAGRYLTFRAGEPSTNLMTVVHPALRLELRTALFQAGQRNENITVPKVVLEIDGNAEAIDLHVRPVRPTDSAHGFFLVLFEKRLEPLGPEAEAARKETASRAVDDELQLLKAQLNATVEQYEISSEELKASNEELQAMNEELRSAAEELETSKEELQSVNEELSTVNHELKEKVEEVGQINSDLQNLIVATDLGTVFLDRELRIERFTPKAREIFNIQASDVGRSIGDFTNKLNYGRLMADAEEVLARLTPVEHEVLARLTPVEHEVLASNARHLLVRIAPYRTVEDKISGVVLTFIDITARKLAEEAARAVGARYKTLFDLVPVAVYTTDAEGVIQEFNNRAVELWGRTPGAKEKFCGSLKIFHSDGRPMPHDQCPMARVLHGEVVEPADLEILVEQANGGRRNVVVAPRAVKNDQGEITGAINCLHDITNRKHAEELLRASEERFRNVADNVPQLIWTNNAEGKANYFNKRWFEYSGLTFDQSYDAGWEAIVHPEDAPASVERWQRALARGEAFDAEYRLRRADGEYRWFIGRNLPLRDGDCRVTGWFGTATDIHDLKMAQSDVRATEERFRLLVEGARDYAMFLLDRDNVITFWSTGAARVFGWSEEEAIGQTGAMIFTPEDRRKGEVEKEITTALEEGRALDRRFHLRKGGSKVWTDGVLMRIDEPDGKVRGFAKVARDATDQRRTEDELAHSRDEMEQRVVERTREVVAMNTELEQTMAQRQQLERELLEISEREKRRIGEDLHDLVCQELSATALYLKSNAKKLAKENATASAALDEAAQTVNRNVVIARALAGGLQAIELTASGLPNALRDLAAQACQNTGNKCHFRCARGVRVRDDTVALHLYRVAHEAVTNAVKHSGAKNILISLDHDETHVCVSVQDDGKGFSVEKRAKRKGKGKGLGLHMMRYRANALGGELKIERRKTGGMDVTCKIPVKR